MNHNQSSILALLALGCSCITFLAATHVVSGDIASHTLAGVIGGALAYLQVPKAAP